MEVHVFQEKYTGVQMVVYHCKSMEQAKLKIVCLVSDCENWLYIGKKTIIN